VQELIIAHVEEEEKLRTAAASSISERERVFGSICQGFEREREH
jgi:hypothetical protein